MLLRRQEHAGITAATGRNLPIAHGAPTCVGPRSKEPSMTITRRVTVHEGPGGRFESMAVFDDAAGAPRPGVLLFPNVLGAKEADFAYAERVAALGLAVLVADMFGQGKRTTRADPDMGRYMAELNDDRALLRDKIGRAHV